MPQPKEDQQILPKQSDPGINFTNILPNAVTQNKLGSHLSNSDILSMYHTSKKHISLFQPQMNTLNALTSVVRGNVATLISLIQKNSGLLFKKGEIKAPRGQTYYNISPYMLMKFLCDEDMITHIMPLIPERFNPIREAQDAELGRGGSDLVKLDFDPMSVSSDDFNKMCAFKTHVNVWDTPTSVTFPLLENPDGLLYWKDDQNEVNFYYANREKQTVIPIIPVASTPEEQRALDSFKDSFDAMENNSARRSTNKEHQLIAKLMRQVLHRQGIHYNDAHGEHYCDSHTPFHLINHYRTAIRLYENAMHNDVRLYEGSLHNDELASVYQYWREQVGKAQGEEMWLLQRICEENRPFYPLPQNTQEFKRGFLFIDWLTSHVEDVFKEGRLAAGLGSDFALQKGAGCSRNRAPRPVFLADGNIALDLIAVCRFIEDAKEKMSTYVLESDQVLQENICLHG